MLCLNLNFLFLTGFRRKHACDVENSLVSSPKSIVKLTLIRFYIEFSRSYSTEGKLMVPRTKTLCQARVLKIVGLLPPEQKEGKDLIQLNKAEFVPARPKNNRYMG